jgi:hypothetical protein
LIELELVLDFEGHRGVWVYRMKPAIHSVGSKIEFEVEDEFDK